jgi:hypothetical protein
LISENDKQRKKEIEREEQREEERSACMTLMQSKEIKQP